MVEFSNTQLEGHNCDRRPVIDAGASCIKPENGPSRTLKTGARIQDLRESLASTILGAIKSN